MASTFETILQAADAVIDSIFGDTVTYTVTATSTETSITATCDDEIAEPIDADTGTAIIYSRTIHISLGDIAVPVKGDTVTVGSRTYTVDRIRTDESQAHLETSCIVHTARRHENRDKKTG